MMVRQVRQAEVLRRAEGEAWHRPGELHVLPRRDALLRHGRLEGSNPK
jgi:hypothetical protein